MQSQLSFKFAFVKILNVPPACTPHQIQGDKSNRVLCLSGPCPQFPTTSPSSIPPKPPPLPSFSKLLKESSEGRWCVTDAIFRLSVREINIDTVCFLPGASWLCVLGFDFIILYSDTFFLKNQTITDVATEIEALILEGLSEQVSCRVGRPSVLFALIV